jgi:hypothetical protein
MGKFKRIAASLLLGASSSYATHTPPTKLPPIPDRVAAVRAALAAKNPPLTLSKGEGLQQEREEIAQFWGNWNNWANWSNWANWANWRNF